MIRHVSRRDFILFVTGTAGAFIVSCTPADGAANDAIPTLVSPSNPEQPPSNASSDRTESADYSKTDPIYGSPSFDKGIIVTETSDFYVQVYGGIATVEAADWSLTIDGLVDNPMTLNYEDILAFETVTEMRTLECIGNPVGGELVGNATWTGFYLKPLLEQIGVKPEAVRAKFMAADDFHTAVDMEWILHEQTMLVHTMNGEPLTRNHGFPLRIMMPGLYGQKMPKWIEHIEFVDDKYQGLWESRGWSDVASVKTNSQITAPRNLKHVKGTFFVEGWAYSGTKSISKVEVQFDGGEWQECQLLHGDSPMVWTQWWAEWAPERTGSFTVAVRSTDETGFLQNEEGDFLASAFPDGTSSIHSVAYTADKPED